MRASNEKMKFRDDSYYIEQSIKGDLKSFALLIEKHKEMAYTLALRIAKNREDAEEIAQDAFMNVYKSLGTFKKEAKFSTWLYKIVYHVAVSRFRKKHIESFPLDDPKNTNTAQAETPDGLDLLHHKERKEVIARAISRLREDEGVVMTLFYLGENSIREIEDITGLTPSNIKILLHRGRNHLLQELKKILKTEIVDIL